MFISFKYTQLTRDGTGVNLGFDSGGWVAEESLEVWLMRGPVNAAIEKLLSW